MDQEWADACAERDFRQLHKRGTWTKRDQADQNRWEWHDSHPSTHRKPYAVCKLCQWVPSTWGEDAE